MQNTYSLRKMLVKNGVWPRHCMTALKKHVFPKFDKPRRRGRFSLDAIVFPFSGDDLLLLHADAVVVVIIGGDDGGVVVTTIGTAIVDGGRGGGVGGLLA